MENGSGDEESTVRLPVSKTLGPVFASHGARGGSAAAASATDALRAEDLTLLLQRHHDQFVKHLDYWMEQLVAIHRAAQSPPVTTLRDMRLSRKSEGWRSSFRSSLSSTPEIPQLKFNNELHASHVKPIPFNNDMHAVDGNTFRIDSSSSLTIGESMRDSSTSLALGETSETLAAKKNRPKELSPKANDTFENKADDSEGLEGIGAFAEKMTDLRRQSDLPYVDGIDGTLKLREGPRDAGESREGSGITEPAATATSTSKKKKSSKAKMSRSITGNPVASVASLIDSFQRIKRAGTDTSFDDIDRSRRKTAVRVADANQRRQNSERDDNEGCLSQLVNSFYFEAFFAAAIITNSVVIGIQVDVAAGNPGAQTPLTFYCISFAYTFVFTLELVLRLVTEGLHFFCSENWHWNFLDVFIVTSSLLEVGLDIVHLVSTTDMEGVSGVSNVRIVRIIRITRLIRIFRIVKIVRFIRALRTLVFSILSTLKSLLWALLLLVMIIYSFGILFAQSVSAWLFEELTDMEIKLQDPQSNATLLKQYWASLPRAMFTLFKAITGGISWDEVVDPLSDVGGFLVMLFIAFIAFATFAVLNVVTGVFCQSAIESAQHDQEMMIQTMMANKKNYIERIQKLFRNLDDDESGFITINELEAHLNDENVQAYFSSLDLDPKDAWTLFKLLDVDKGNMVDVEEFVCGCMRLKGDAKSIDVAKLTYETKWMMKRLLEFMTYVELQFTLIQEGRFDGLSGFGWGSEADAYSTSASDIGSVAPSTARGVRTGQLGDIIKGISSIKGDGFSLPSARRPDWPPSNRTSVVSRHSRHTAYTSERSKRPSIAGSIR